MRVLYVGCNLFGQLTHSTEISFETFQSIDVENFRNISIGHSILIFHTDQGVYMHGHGLKPHTMHEITKLELPSEEEKINYVVTSDTRIFFLADSGEVYFLDFLDNKVKIRLKKQFVIKNGIHDGKIIKLACGVLINVAVCSEGHVYNVPNELEFQCENIVQVCAGNEHCLILDGNGNVYSLGRSRRGQLGHGDLEDETEPHLINALAGLKVVKIDCGSWHSCALTEDGDVYVWGWNSDGQLGLFDDESEENEEEEKDEDASNKIFPNPVSVITVPTLIGYDFGDQKVINAACGSRHTVLFTDDNILYGCGCNRFNQLGLKDRNSIYEVQKLYKLEDTFEMYDIKCGPAATALIVDKK